MSDNTQPCPFCERFDACDVKGYEDKLAQAQRTIEERTKQRDDFVDRYNRSLQTIRELVEAVVVLKNNSDWEGFSDENIEIIERASKHTEPSDKGSETRVCVVRYRPE
jgi:hypothetical protein